MGSSGKRVDVERKDDRKESGKAKAKAKKVGLTEKEVRITEDFFEPEPKFVNV
jgi:hypothetical protein